MTTEVNPYWAEIDRDDCSDFSDLERIMTEPLAEQQERFDNYLKGWHWAISRAKSPEEEERLERKFRRWKIRELESQRRSVTAAIEELLGDDMTLEEVMSS